MKGDGYHSLVRTSPCVEEPRTRVPSSEPRWFFTGATGPKTQLRVAAEAPPLAAEAPPPVRIPVSLLFSSFSCHTSEHYPVQFNANLTLFIKDSVVKTTHLSEVTNAANSSEKSVSRIVTF